jgi:hypothetical protein
MEPRKIELNQLSEYLGNEKAKTIIKQGWLVVKPNKVGAT